MSVKPGVATTRTIIKDGEGIGNTGSTTQGAPTPLPYGRQMQTDGLTASGNDNTPT